jgi:hypothetical protein
MQQIWCKEDFIMKLDEGKLNEFVEKAVSDLAAGYGKQSEGQTVMSRLS